MGGGTAFDGADVVAYTVVGQAHPVPHRGTLEAAAGRHNVHGKIGIAVNFGATGVVDVAVFVGSLFDNLLKNVEGARRCWANGNAGADRVIDYDLVTVHEEPALFGEADVDRGVFRVGLGKQAVIFPNRVGFWIAGVCFEMIVGASGKLAIFEGACRWLPAGAARQQEDGDCKLGDDSEQDHGMNKRWTNAGVG